MTSLLYCRNNMCGRHPDSPLYEIHKDKCAFSFQVDHLGSNFAVALLSCSYGWNPRSKSRVQQLGGGGKQENDQEDFGGRPPCQHLCPTRTDAGCQTSYHFISIICLYSGGSQPSMGRLQMLILFYQYCWQKTKKWIPKCTFGLKAGLESEKVCDYWSTLDGVMI